MIYSNTVKRFVFKNITLFCLIYIISSCKHDVSTQLFDTSYQYIQTVQAFHSYVKTNCGQLDQDAMPAVASVHQILLVDEFPIYQAYLSTKELAIVEACRQQYRNCLSGKTILSNQQITLP